MTPVEYEKSLKDGKGEKMALYDFSAKVLDEFFSGILVLCTKYAVNNQNDCALITQKKAQKLEPIIPVGQRYLYFVRSMKYSSVGCSPAEPSSASLCQCKNSNNPKINQKKLSTIECIV